jgi:hypothetical protein
MQGAAGRSVGIKCPIYAVVGIAPMNFDDSVPLSGATRLINGGDHIMGGIPEWIVVLF